MSPILRPGDGFLFMKVGTHAQERLESIIERKRKEIADAGLALWGYGGNTCHPQNMVQPFAASFEKKGQTIFLCMQEMNSRHAAVSLRAEEYSSDGRTWIAVPPQVNVIGSRYALVLKDLRHEEFELDLSNTRVAIGNSQGRSGDKYISGRVDKACLEVTDQLAIAGTPEQHVRIGLVAELMTPFAVYVRNRS